MIDDKAGISLILKDPAFADFGDINVLPLIYDEKKKPSNSRFRFFEAMKCVARIILEKKGKGRKHPVYRFYDDAGAMFAKSDMAVLMRMRFNAGFGLTRKTAESISIPSPKAGLTTHIIMCW